ncbi:class I SAM-dependent methyltransferase [Halorussus salinus]|uniref:class I SAM-dependent methyltransferase n=1 Tax=Halorussus salinus TaxID=1364935 RepID=UPI001091925E|nr:class I SAM-dependent methyltransferase [Halorussus salinus]
MARTAFHHAYYVYKRTGIRELFRQALIEAENFFGRHLSLSHQKLYQRSVNELHRRMESEDDIKDAIETAFSYRGYGVFRSIEPFQQSGELRELLDSLQREDIDSVLEIGTARGGSLYLWCRTLEQSNTFLSVDLPGGEFGGGYSEHRIDLFREFVDDANMQFIRRNSHDPETVRMVEDATPENGIDLLFIDGDHTYEGVKKDFYSYSALLDDNGIVVLHDILGNPHDPDVEVDQFWQELRQEYKTEEIVESPEQDWGGLGVVYV